MLVRSDDLIDDRRQNDGSVPLAEAGEQSSEKRTGSFCAIDDRPAGNPSFCLDVRAKKQRGWKDGRFREGGQNRRSRIDFALNSSEGPDLFLC